MTSVEFAPRAAREFEEAVDYYETARHGLGLRFREEVRHLTELLVDFPEAGMAVRKGIRRAVVPAFPWFVYYRVISRQRLRVLALVHHAHRPPAWVT